MRNLTMLAALPAMLLVAGCTSSADVPPKVTWSYGAGNGDGVSPSGPAATYSFANGVGADVPVNSGQKPAFSYAYGADGTTGDVVQMSPQPPKQQVAQPAPTKQNPAPGTHS